ncbi:hypothetical protein R5R35_010424 [Gryllus longicercus]|uniref:Uncharacterized protein n=1 Tax=Gryllus longicercus TaxID=2509291 RepID=A0AAN9VTS0_9ORTH
MIPDGETLCAELTVNDHAYIICLVAENSPEQLSVYVTDCEEFFKGCITSEQLTLMEKELKVYSQKSRSNLFRIAMKQKKISFSKVSLQLNFTISSETINVTMEKIEENNRSAYIKALFFRMAKEMSGPEEKMSPAKPSMSTTIRINSQARSVKQKLPGTSIVNPGVKRIRTGTGVKFEED